MFGPLLVLGLMVSPRAEIPQALRELLVAGRHREACDRLEEALAATPGDRELREALVDTCMRIGRYTAALEFAEPLGESANRTRGLALYLVGRYAEAVELLPEDEETILYRHESLRALARHEEARACLERARELLGEDHIEVRVRHAQELVASGDHAAAIPVFQRVLADDPIVAPALFGLGRALVRTGEREQGLALLERHRELLPLLDARDFAIQNLDLDRTHAPSHAQLAGCLQALVPHDPAMIEAAARSYARATELARGPQVPPIALRHARFEEHERRNPERALQLLTEAHRRQPDVRLLVRSGDVRVNRRDFEGAIRDFEAALLMRPGDEAIQRRLDGARLGSKDQR